MRCEELRERFLEPDAELQRHLESCSECREEWLVFRQLQSLRAPRLDPTFDLRVLAGLTARGHFRPAPPNLAQKLGGWLARALAPVAVLACLLLLVWLGDLALTRPGPEVRSLRPETARLWIGLPDAMPVPGDPGPAPPGAGVRVGRERDDQNT